MIEHKHEWQIALNEVYCACQQTMTFEDAERRINEYEVLKAEIERLREAVSPYHVGDRYGPTESQVAILQEWARQNDERLGYSGSSLSQYLLGIAEALQGGEDE